MSVTACERRGLLCAWEGFLEFLGGTGSRRDVWECKTAGGPGASKLVDQKWKGAETFPEFPSPSITYPPNYLSEASKVCCEAGPFWARNSVSARLGASL